MSYDALLFISFGGPEGSDDVMPFLERVTKGRRVPRERLEEVAKHYLHFGGVSPINSQNRALIEAVREKLSEHGVNLPIYFGNRNWKPFIIDALREMQADGKSNALAFFTSLFSCYSGCRQYRENIEAARVEIGSDAPTVDKVRFGFNHPGFIGAMADRVTEALREVPEERRDTTHLLYTAHSIPLRMAAGAAYELQLRESARLVTEAAGRSSFTLSWQSRSGAPTDPWLEPDINDSIRAAKAAGATDVVVSPIGFISDHLEVLWDLDDEAKSTAESLGLGFTRAGTVGTHPLFVEAVANLFMERLNGRSERQAIGKLGAWHDVCPANCCPIGR